MTDTQYWEWFWLNFKWGMIIGGPFIIAILIWAGIKYWYEDSQEDKPEDHFTKLDLR